MTRGITVGTTLEAMVEAQGGKYDDKLKLQGQVVGWGIEWLQVRFDQLIAQTNVPISDADPEQLRIHLSALRTHGF